MTVITQELPLNFAVHRTDSPHGVCVAVSGAVDVRTAPRFREAIRAAVREAATVGRPWVIIDLGAVTHLDSDGLAALLTARREGRSSNISVVIDECPPQR